MHKEVIRKERTVLLMLFFVITALISCGTNGNETSNILSDSNEIKDTTTATVEVDSAVTDTSVAKPSLNTNADWLLVPGVSAGQTKIGDNAEDVYKRLGTPDGGDAAMQKAVAIWFSHHDSTAHSIAIYTARSTDSAAIARVLQIRITSPSFTTKQGIRTGSFLADIQSKFAVKQTETYEDAGANYKVYDGKEGIAFEVNGNGKCVAIIIHKAGITGEGTYLKFRTTNKFTDQNR